MKLFILAISCQFLAAIATNEDAWTETEPSNDHIPDPPSTELLVEPPLPVLDDDFDQELVFAEVAPGGETAETPFGDTSGEGGQRKQYITNYLNRVYRDLCHLPSLTELKVESVTSRVMAGKEFIVKATVDGEAKTIVFQRLLENDKHPGKSPHKETTAQHLRDLFHVVSIKPHPCASHVTAELVEEGPTTPYSTGLKMPAKVHYSKSLISEEERSQIPSDWDWRDHVVGGHNAKAAQTQNQGSCGSCWAFAASATMSYQLNIKSEGRYDVQPSPQIGMSCSDDTPCHGGWMKQMYKSMDSKGLPPAWAVPYLAKKGPCQTSSKAIEYYSTTKAPENCVDTSTASNCAYWISHNTDACKTHTGILAACQKSCGCPGKISMEYKGESDMLAEIYHNGPSAVCLAAVGGFTTYRSGVYSPTSAEQKKDMNHAVTLIGFGTMSGKKYWLIQNSWGAGWGDGGFIKLERGINALKVESCGISSGFADVTSDRVKCKTAQVCKNGGAYTEDCSCQCAAGFTGSDCSGCNKQCSGSQFAGSASTFGGKCQCQCATGFHNMHNLQGYSDCAVKFHFNGFEGILATLSFSVSGSAPANKIQNVKKGDIVVAVRSGLKPWTAATGWNTELKANVCGEKVWPAQVCASSTIRIAFPATPSGDYDLFYIKYNGQSEFGSDKGYGSDFLFLQTISAGGSNPTSDPTPTPATAAPGTAEPTPTPATAAPSTAAPSPTPAPSADTSTADDPYWCPDFKNKYGCAAVWQNGDTMLGKCPITCHSGNDNNDNNDNNNDNNDNNVTPSPTTAPPTTAAPTPAPQHRRRRRRTRVARATRRRRWGSL